MPYLSWNKSLSVHVESMDAQHKHLISMLNQLHDTFDEESKPKAVRSVLNGLLVYVKIHFWQEERLMQAHHFPGLEAHRREHEALVERTDELAARFKDGETTLGPEILYFLKKWIREHIQGSDMEYGRHIEGQKRKAA
jgi:hemerythrin-like metal-binding protein